MDDIDKDEIILFMVVQLLHFYFVAISSFMHHKAMYRYKRRMLNNRTFFNHSTHLEYIDSIIRSNDVSCVDELKMDRRTFGILYELLCNTGRLKTNSTISVEEQVCMFLHILAHHVKNRTVQNRFFRSGETISRYFNSVLSMILQLYNELLVSPSPVLENYFNKRWKWFKVNISYTNSYILFI